MTASTAATDRIALGKSGRPALGSRNSGSSVGPSTSRSTIIGTLTRKTEPHQKYSSRNPPSGGPITAPAEKLEIQTPIATARCFGSRNILRITARLALSSRVDGRRVLLIGGEVPPELPGRAGVGVPATEIFDPTTGGWTTGPTLDAAFFSATVTMLGNGKVRLRR